MPEVINAADLHTYLECDFNTWKLFWKARPADMFGSAGLAKRWNERYAGKEAFTAPCGHGYRVGKIKRTRHQAHRVVFALFHGRWPSALIDHIDLDKMNNRPENLREATRLQNAWNKGLTKQNTSGFKGVSFHAGTGRWISQVWCEGKSNFLGRYDTPEAAALAYDAKAIELHGEYAQLNFPKCPVLSVSAFALADNNRRYKRVGKATP